MPKLLLVDGSNYLFRAFHALPPLTTSKGEPTGAIKGFNGMLKTVCDVVKPDCEICVFDAKGKNFRHKLFAEYKANRPPLPEELRIQIEPIFELVKLLGWPLLQVEGVEADDVLGTLARQAAAQGWDVVIATGDKDLAQLVNERITLINTMSRTQLDREGVFEKYGVYPERIIDYLALMGDKVDNVPGINKCGPKTAAKWIAEYGSLEGVVANAASVTGKIGEYLRQGLPFLDLARELVTINTSAPVTFDAQTYAKAAPDDEGLARFFTRWEMSNGAKRGARAAKKPAALAATGDLFAAPSIPTEAGVEPAVAAPVASGAVRVVRTPDELKALSEELTAAASSRFPVAMWVACDNLNAMHDKAAGIAFALTPLSTAYVPLSHTDGLNAAAANVLATLAPWFASPSSKLFYDAKHCLHVLANSGLPVAGTVHDAMLMSYVLEAHLRHDFSKLAARTAAVSADDDEAFFGKGASRRNAADIGIDETAAFGCRTAALLRTAASVMAVKLAEDESLERIYRELELPVMRVLASMERTGVLIDRDKLAQQSAELASRIDEVKAKIETIAGGAFNPASPKQLAQVLFEKLGLPVKKKTASGTPSTDEEVLTERPRLSAAQAHSRIPGSEQTQEHLHRQTAADGRRGRRTCAHDLRAGHGGDGAPGKFRPQSSEHSRAHPRGASRARGLRGQAGLQNHLGRLLADRAAHHGAHLAGRGPAAGLPRRQGYSPRHRRRSLRRARRCRHARAAPHGQGDQLRSHLRHERLWLGAEPRDRTAHGRALH